MSEEFNLSEKENGCYGCEEYPKKNVKEFVKQRIFDATRLLALFNQDKLTSEILREHRQKIKDAAGERLI